MFIRAATLGVTFAVALIGIFLNVSGIKVKVALAALAAASFALALFIEIQAAQDARFAKRALERLIQASTPSNLFADAVVQIVIAAGVQHDLGQCVAIKRKLGDGYVCQVIFTDESERLAEGYFEFDHELLARWSLFDESRLSEEVVRDMFDRGPAPAPDPKDSWKELVDFVGKVGRGLYPDMGAGAFAVSADFERVEIGLPYPPEVSTAAGKTKQLMLDGESTSFLVFSTDELVMLTGKSYLAASRIVAKLLENIWGEPTTLRP
jgi:hypothetical protein